MRRKDTRTGKPCGQGGKTNIAVPLKEFQRKPQTKSEMSKSQLARKKAEKRKVGWVGCKTCKKESMRRCLICRRRSIDRTAHDVFIERDVILDTMFAVLNLIYENFK